MVKIFDLTGWFYHPVGGGASNLQTKLIASRISSIAALPEVFQAETRSVLAHNWIPSVSDKKNNKNKNKKWKPRHLKEEDVNKYEKPCQVVLLRKLTKERRSIPSTIYGFPQG